MVSDSRTTESERPPNGASDPSASPKANPSSGGKAPFETDPPALCGGMT